jgi:hypothetical protein
MKFFLGGSKGKKERERRWATRVSLFNFERRCRGVCFVLPCVSELGRVRRKEKRRWGRWWNSGKAVKGM